MVKMKIGIIGGGSIGLLYTWYLSEHHSVCLYVHSKEQLALLTSEGLHLERGAEVERKAIDVKLFSEWCGEEDILIVAVKQYHISDIMKRLTAYSTPHHTFLFLQNGMGHMKWFKKIRGEIYVGIVEHGAMKINANHVMHTGVGLTKIAAFRHSHPAFQSFVTAISKNIKFPFIIEENYENMMLKKLVVNAIINPLTAVLRVKNGDLLKNPYYYSIVLQVFSEVKQSLLLQDEEFYFQNVQDVCQKTADNKSSMLRDLEENRPTEIDAILGFILEKAAERKIDTPILDLLFKAVKGKECRVED
jgi:2-dehydropantoate 2-reductase